MMRLLCAGEAFEDLIFVGLDRLPGPGEEVKTDRFVATIGGGAVITAVTAARLGRPTTVMTAVGAAGVARLRRENVALTNLIREGEAPAISAALSTTDDRAFVTFNGVNSRLEPRLARELLRVARATRPPAHVHLAFFPHDCATWSFILGNLRAKGITTSWDFGWNEPLTSDRGLQELVDALDFVFVNEMEARLYAGVDSLGAALDAWRARAAITIVKLGDEGSAWLAPDRTFEARAPQVNAVDTTGAGDAFNGGFLHAWLGGKTPVQCLKAGNRAGAESTKRPGGLPE